ncbi:MAG TPA: nucleotidyl transferase AbiEii/AbiGii toxin family protein [Bacteroidota bacterium]|nr:nucleotidyl transferase AbiEii/AbiGii toxin family protein [Bacteroidota bacterium]
MVTKSEYEFRGVSAAKSVLVELIQILGEYRESIVLIGGWVPFFYFDATHTGSMDIDVALDRQAITEEVYHTIREHLETRGYRPGAQPYQFFRDVVQEDGSTIEVGIDFLAGEYGGTGKKHRHQDVQHDLKARKARGCELAIEHHTKITISGTMPGGAENTVEVSLSDLVPFIVMKGMALYDRLKEKDAWDIYYCVKHVEGGHEALAALFSPLISERLVIEGLEKLRLKFLTLGSIGPVSVMNFEEAVEREEQERIQRDAFEQINALLDLLNIQAFK